MVACFRSNWAVAGVLSVTALSGCGGGGTSGAATGGPSAPTVLAAPAPTVAPAPVLTTAAAPAAVDTAAPSAPSTLRVSGSTIDSVSLSWLASSDDVGVVGYEIWRNGARIQLTPASQTTFSDSALAPNTSYSYTVRALDAAGNTSTFSVDLVVRTQPASTPGTGTGTPTTTPADTTAPSTPTGLSGSAASASTLTFSWVASTDNQSVARYEIYSGSILVASTAQTSYALSGLTASTAYSLTIKAFDAAGNASGTSTALVLTTAAAPATPTPDTTAPTAPTGLAVTQTTSSSLNLNWVASTDNIGVVRYDAYKDGVLAGNTSTPGFLFTGLAASRTYTLTVKAVDAAGNSSAASAGLSASTASATPPADTTAPTAPTNLVASNATSSSLTLTWTASTDNVGVVRYDVYKGGALAGSVTATSSTLSGLNASSSYALTVKAVDAAGNVSAASATLNASTTAAADTTAPTAPTNLVASNATSSSLTLSWTASTDNVGVVRYDVYKGGALAGSVTATSSTLSGLNASSSYALTVKAVDAAGNVSAASATLNASTTAAADTTAPSAPTNLVASNATSSSLTLSWTASMDNVGVVRYDVYSGGVLAGNTTGTSMAISGLSASTSYTLTVKAADAAGNVSAASAGVTGTTTASSQPTVSAQLNVRVQGLAMGEQVTLGHGSASLTATMNDPYSFPTQSTAGLDLRITTQPLKQTCAVSESAPASVPNDGSPVFVRCVHNVVSSITMPDTLPNDPLAVNIDMRDVAYPGIAYESRPGVVGGIFPYEYRLKSFTLNNVAQSTSGVSLDFRRGTVRFTPASEGTYVVTLEIKDSGSTQKSLQKSFTIVSSASRFVFVSPSGVDSTGRGAIATPYRSLNFAMGQSARNQVIMMRKGTYDTSTVTDLFDSKSKQILGYPDEVAVLDFAGVRAFWIKSGDSSSPTTRIEGVDMANISQYAIACDPCVSGITIRNVRFLTGVSNQTSNDNAAFIYTMDYGLRIHKMLIQENDFGKYTFTASTSFNYAGMVLFSAGDSIIENNQARQNQTSSIAKGFVDKGYPDHNTFRENYIELAASQPEHDGIFLMAQDGAHRDHVHHNLLVNAGVVLGGQCFQTNCEFIDNSIHHNTLAGGGIVFSWGPFNPVSSGTRVSNNIISSRTFAPYYGLSCQARPSTSVITSKISVVANMVESSNSLALKDSECSGNDTPWAEWRGTYGMDTIASGSTLSTPSVLVGSGVSTGLPAGDARRTQRGHQY